MVETSLPALLRERASLQPDDTAYTFVDYDQDWAGVAVSLTWPQLYRRVLNVARELRGCAEPGDRAMVIAPQGLDYIVAFLGALHAGVIPVPLSVPMGGVADERVESVLRDAVPVAVLTTSSVVTEVAASVAAPPSGVVPTLLEVDLLDLDAPIRPGAAERSYEAEAYQETAYLQYTSGSTRSPAGVMVSYKNLMTNLQQITSDFVLDLGGVAPADLTFVSWLPFYHDLGLIMGVCSPVFMGSPAVLTSPISFLQRPARWMQLVASHPDVFTGAPNFAFDLAARKTSDDDMAGLDLGRVLTIQNGAERVQPVTVQRFRQRFAKFGLRPEVIQPCYGLAEATLYVAARRDPEVVHFDSESLITGSPRRDDVDAGSPLISYGAAISSISPTVRIVDPDTRIECPPGTPGEIWVHGNNVTEGYWQKPEENERIFHATISDPTPGTPEGPWLRTGDRGFYSDGDLFVVGRLKDLLIIYGRNHAPDDIEATISEITSGRSVAIAVPDDGGVEQLVVVMEVKKRGETDEEVKQHLSAVSREVTAAISNTHGIAVADLVVVAPGTIPITTSGKVRRQSCAQRYQQKELTRLT
jgi:long-chain fatty acid adenylyltransferase FadD28